MHSKDSYSYPTICALFSSEFFHLRHWKESSRQMELNGLCSQVSGCIIFVFLQMFYFLYKWGAFYKLWKCNHFPYVYIKNHWQLSAKLDSHIPGKSCHFWIIWFLKIMSYYYCLIISYEGLCTCAWIFSIDSNRRASGTVILNILKGNYCVIRQISYKQQMS